MRAKPWFVIASIGVIVSLAALVASSAACSPKQKDIRSQVDRIATSYAFDFVSWELNWLPSAAEQICCRKRVTTPESKLSHQIQSVLQEEGITVFPPLVFELGEPPHLLVASPREKIVYLHRVVLRQELSTIEIESLEKQVDELGISSLVATLAGFSATYPPIASSSLGVADTVEVVVEEWFHQYLAFKPLGFLYLLDSIGMRQDSDAVTMNETLAGMVSQEVTTEVCRRFYGEKKVDKPVGETRVFDFAIEMRQTRQMVDRLLAQGKVEEAERYMEERRLVFLARGYRIRKLNQAYFAFHGIYGQDPASVSPVYRDLKQLRTKSASLKDFVDKVSGMTSYDELVKTLGE